MKEGKIIRKIKRLLVQAQIPRYLHRFGPKTYLFWRHALALLIKQECKLSYRRISNLLKGLGFRVPTYSALAKMSKRIPLELWRALLSASAGVSKPLIAAVDATFYSTSNPSAHYLRRIDGVLPNAPVETTAIREVCSQKWLSIAVHIGSSGESPQALRMLRRMKKFPLVLVADKAYDVEYIHEQAYRKGMLTVIPSHKARKHGFYRRKMRRRFNLNLYHRRSLIEAAFSSNKRRNGNYVLSRTARSQRAEIHARYITDNLKLIPSKRDFQQSPLIPLG